MPAVVLLLAQIAGMPDIVPHQKHSGATSPLYIELLEQNSHIIYPALAILVLVLIVAGILQAWKTQDLDGLQKAELKKEIVVHLRQEIGGAPAEALARRVGVPPIKLMKLLEEMQKDNILSSHTNTDRLTIWRLKGAGPAQSRF
ncbi:MAG: hypothetical protein QM723_16335 [Myxococcaceae bacterium]